MGSPHASKYISQLNDSFSFFSASGGFALFVVKYELFLQNRQFRFKIIDDTFDLNRNLFFRRHVS